MQTQVPIELQALVRRTYRALMELSGGQARQGQRQMIGAIASAVANAKERGKAGSGARLLAVDAPTGSGKSYAYGVGAIPIGVANGLKVVLSTGKVGLQEQLVERDLVTLKKVVPEMRVAIVKGRSRYGCVVRMQQAAADGGEVGHAAEDLLASLEEGSWSGDVDELAKAPADGVWAGFTNDRAGCAGRKCSAYTKCPYYAARKRIESANVLVTNHAMLMADLRAGNTILPRPEDMCLVVDEAHLLPRNAVESLADGHTLEDAQRVAQECDELVAAVRRADRHGECGQLAAKAVDAIGVMRGTLSEARLAVESLGSTTRARDASRPVRFKGGKLPQWLDEVAGHCQATSEAAKDALQLVLEALQGEAGDTLADKVRERLLVQVGQAVGRVDRIAWVWRLMTANGNSDGPTAKWIEVAGEAREIRVCASPVGVGEYLHETLWSKVAASIHLSGTLNTVGSMEPYLRESGLDRTEGVRTLSVESPFDFKKQATLVVPANVCNPKDVAGHTQWLIENIPMMVERNPDGEGALVLFTSFSQMKDVADAAPAWFKERLLVQGTLSKREILAKHGEAIASGMRSVIFGTASFEEGVDLPGRLCTLVVLAKLQFAVPNDPVSEELREHMEGKGISHFDAVVVPAAWRRLAQSSGRLIRTETDAGMVVVADPRLTSTAYGRRMLASLPPYRVSNELPMAA